jgi:hypothetical protein
MNYFFPSDDICRGCKSLEHVDDIEATISDTKQLHDLQGGYPSSI